MIFYFSATGNCKYVATRLTQVTGQEMYAVADCTRNGQYDFSDETIGIISPTYDWGLPSIVKDFFEKASFRTDYLYFIATYGTTPGATGYMANKAIRGARSMRIIPFAWLIPGRQSLIFPRPKRLQSTQRIPKRRSTASFVASANGAQTVICHHALRHLSPNGLLNQSITKRFGVQRISVLRKVASAADCVQRNVPFKRLRCGISTRSGLRKDA